MKGARLLALALLALTTTACEPHRRPGALPVCDVEDGYHRGDFELIFHPRASYGDDGVAYDPKLTGQYVIAAIGLSGPAGTETPVYVYSAAYDEYWCRTTLPGYQAGMSQVEPFASTITSLTDRLHPVTPGAVAPDVNLRRLRRLTDRARRAINADPLRLGGAACVGLLLVLVLLGACVATVVDAVIGTVTSLLTTLSDISAKHRLISHANSALRSKRRKGGSK